MNNDNVKDDLCKCLNENYIFPAYEMDFIYYFYVGSLIRLNNLDNYKDIIKDESTEFIINLNYFGNIPLFYYSLKRVQNENGEYEYFIKKEKEKIIEEIKSFYKENKKFNNDNYYIQMLNDLLKIMSLINNKQIFFFEELSKELLKLPLKYLEIKKEKIKINDLKLYGLVSNNTIINNFIKNLEEKGSDSELIEKEKILINYTKFINEEKYCSNYISKITDNEKKRINFNKTNFNNEITIFYLDYLFPLMEEIFSLINYQILSSSSNYLYKELSPQLKGGLLEFIISEYVKNKKQFLYYYINYFEIIENFVSNQFFIQDYTSRKTDIFRTFIENKNTKIDIKKKLPKNNIFFTQFQFTGKYYDCALLVPTQELSSFKLLLLKISKKKISSQRLFKEEHAIILNRVKNKLEKEYDIIIIEGHFSYILTYEEPDNDTIIFCKNNNINYFLFSINDMCFKKFDGPVFNDNTLITRSFPIHTSFSILPKEMFKIKDGKLCNYNYIKDIQNKLLYEKIEDTLNILLNKFFKPVYDFDENDKNEFFLFGNFDEVFKVNNSFSIWFNNNDLFLYTYDKNDKCIKLELKYSKKLSNKKYSLICSKYKIFK